MYTAEDPRVCPERGRACEKSVSTWNWLGEEQREIQQKLKNKLSSIYGKESFPFI
jgi:hypothetical protein